MIDIISRILIKMSSPWLLRSNPILMIVWVIAFTATILTISQYYAKESNYQLSMIITFWLWMTILFAKLAEVLVEIRWSKNASVNNDNKSEKIIKKIFAINDINNDYHKKYIEVKCSSIKSGDLILLLSGEIVPFDGVVVAGTGYVNETDSTGALSPTLKSHDDYSNRLVTGSFIESSDWLIMKVTLSGRKSFFAKLTKLLSNIERQQGSNEIALQRIIWGLGVLFISVLFSIAAIADYSGIKIPIIYLLDMVVILLPTTLSGLQHAIIMYGTGALKTKHIIIRDKVALDNAVDVNVVVLDKTGTITVGQREMVDFIAVDQELSEKFINTILYLSSVLDDTTEGESIKHFTEHQLEEDVPNIDFSKYQYLPFAATHPISGCDYYYPPGFLNENKLYQEFDIRKGSITEICKYLGLYPKLLPENIRTAIRDITEVCGSVLLVTLNHKIFGIIHLRDKLRKQIKKQIQKIQDDGILTIMLTGDNANIAGYIAKKLGMHAYYAEVTPEKKLEFIRNLQQQGYTVAMYGDGVGDIAALAQADIGIAFDRSVESVKSASNVVLSNNNIANILDIRNVCRIMAIKLGALTVFSLGADIAKYFVIVPALFTTAFPSLSVLNLFYFNSLDSVILSSVMFNALVTLVLIPIVFSNPIYYSKHSLWSNLLLYGLGGILSPFIFIKMIDMFVHWLGLV